MTITIPFRNPLSLPNGSMVVTQVNNDSSLMPASTGYVQNNFSIFSGTTSIVTLGIITSGTWNGTAIGIGFGGTGATTANGALNNFLPSQTGNARKHLETDGANTSWGIVGLIPTASQVGTTYTAVDRDLVIINAATHTTTLPIASLGKQVGVTMINATITNVLIKTSSSSQNINGTDRSSTGFPITSQFEVYLFQAISSTDWIILNTSRITKPISVSGIQDGTNKIFTIGSIPVGLTLQFYENGQLLSVINDYTLSSSTLTYVSARNAPLVSDNLTAFAVPVQ